MQRQRIAIDGSSFAVLGVPDLRFCALPLSSKAAPYSPQREHPTPDDNIGMLISAFMACGRFRVSTA